MRAPSELWTRAVAAAADRHTMGLLGIGSPVLMERAGLCVAHEVAELRRGTGLPVVVLCGPGNNGGDGLAVCRQLFGWEIPARAVLCADKHNEAVARQLAMCRSFGVTVLSQWPGVHRPTLVVDALLGTGSRGAPRGRVADALRQQRALQGPRVAVDLPTGVDADTGAVWPDAFRATTTVTFVRSKPGLHMTPGRAYAGRVVVADIGLVGEPDRNREHTLVDPGLVDRVLSRLPAGAHKGQRGHLGIVGGSAGTPGAAILAASGALRSGAGLATIATDDPGVQAQLVAHRPEVMVQPRRGGTALLPQADTLCIGPGLTQPDDLNGVAALWSEDPRPAVFDASALDVVPLRTVSGGPRVITPHPGEAARLLARAEPDETWTSARVQADRGDAARRLARVTAAVVVLKGEGTLIAVPAADDTDPPHLHIVVSGGPALATAGSGDVLAGIVGGLMARGVQAGVAAAAAAYVHGIAGECLEASGPGGLAMDIADATGPALARIRGPQGRVHTRWPGIRRG